MTDNPNGPLTRIDHRLIKRQPFDHICETHDGL